jgi:hypothetical protein
MKTALALVLVAVACLASCAGKSAPARPVFNIYDPPFEVPFPSSFYLAEDSNSPTGKRPSMKKGFNNKLDRVMGIEAADFSAASIIDDIQTLDGFSTVAPIFVSFDGALDPGAFPAWEDSDDPRAPVLLIDITGWNGSPGFDLASRLSKYFLSFDRGSNILSVKPFIPLRGGSEYMLVIRTSLKSGRTTGIGRAVNFDRLLEEPFMKRTAAFLASGIIDPGGVAVAFDFTTQNTTPELRYAASSIDGLIRDYGPSVTGVHSGGLIQGLDPAMVGSFLIGYFQNFDFRNQDQRFDSPKDMKPHYKSRGTVEFNLTLPNPLRCTAPYPLLLLQHGLASSKYNTEWLPMVNLASERCYATIGIDADKHGFRKQEGAISAAFDFIDITRPAYTRDNVRQSVLDMLMAARIAGMIPPSGLGCQSPCFSAYSKGFIGESLGGILGSIYTSLDRRNLVSAIFVGGGELSSTLRLGEYRYVLLLKFFTGMMDSLAVEDMLFALAQTVVDRADPVNYAMGLFRAPFHPEDIPANVFLIEAVGDQALVNESTEALARAFGMSLVGPAYRFIEGCPLVDSPLAGNYGRNGSRSTVGTIQMRFPGMKEKDNPHTFPLKSAAGRAMAIGFLDSTLVTSAGATGIITRVENK